MNKRIFAGILGLVITASCVFIEDAKGYAWLECKSSDDPYTWDGKYIKWYAGTNSFKSGSSRRTALVRALGRWNQAPGGFTYSDSVYWNDTSVSRTNKNTEVWFSNTLASGSATCYTDYYCLGNKEYIKKADIVFDNAVSWSYTTNQFSKEATFINSYTGNVYGGSRRSFVTTALHEMGHALGLLHENRRLNIMGQDMSHLHANAGKIRAYVGEDAVNGEIYLYGMTGNILKEDLSVSHWKFWKKGGTDNEYSLHILTKMYYVNSGNVVSGNWAEEIGVDGLGVRLYKVKKGTSYKVQFTYENNGYYDLSGVKVGFYISSNNNITTMDYRFDSRTFTLTRDRPFTKKLTLTIPSNMTVLGQTFPLTVGQIYWLGVIVDYKNSILEFSEDNNAAYLAIKIIP
ncbi:MAG: matrixin family metalloprotease [Planctomycetes bacterium]|nr:matrixin family metalloprotease [Planctomycetota bacterium]